MAIINTVPKNINPYARWVSHYLRSVAILIQSPEIKNLYYQWQSQYIRPKAILIVSRNKFIRPVAISIHTPSGNISNVPNKWKPIRPMAVSIYTPSGNINTVSRNINSYAP